MGKAPRNLEPARRWAAFLSNHREAIAAMDFFTVPTIPFGVLYCFFLIAHNRRSILHFNVTRHPTSAWVIQQLREAFPYDSRRAISDLIQVRTSMTMSLIRSRASELSPSEQAFKAHGRMESRSASSAAVAGTGWTL
jgi:hypothetical protein